MSELEINSAPTEAEIEELRERLIGYNVSKHGYTDVSRIGIFVRNEDGSLGAGIYGYAWGGCCEIELLWISEERRSEGLGTRLMAAAEEEIRRIGCSMIVLDTFSFQAPGFYRKLGFEIVSEIAEFPEGHQHYMLVKRLT